MPIIFDYLKWRGDLLFTERKLNEVDNLIFSELAYFDFGQVMPINKDQKITIREAYNEYKKMIAPTSYFVNDPTPLLKKCANTKRFRDIVVSDYKEIYDKKKQIQYASVVFKLDDDSIYVAYRGTDSSIIGWKEDFNLVYMEVTPAQEIATKYLEEMIMKYATRTYVGGHSKGGNLAVYSSAFCNQAFKELIVDVFSNDGPGFNMLVINKPEYQSILPKINHFIPSDSIVGTMLDVGKKSTVIVSSAKNGIDQHNPYTWEISRDRLKKSRVKPKVGYILDDTVKGWITMTEPSTRKKVIDKIYEAVSELDADTLEELNRNKISSIATLIKIAATQDNNVKKKAFKTIGEIIKSGKDAIQNKH